MNMLVREATMADAEAISQLATETFFETYSWYNTPENMKAYTTAHFSPEQTKKELQEARTKFFLAHENGKLIGYAKLRVFEMPKELEGKKHIEMERIYVRLSDQKKNIGHALMNACKAFAKIEAYEILWLGVWEKNPKAIAFYKKEGFTCFGEHAFQLGDDTQLDHLFMIEL